MADRVMIIEGGQVTKCGPTEEILPYLTGEAISYPTVSESSGRCVIRRKKVREMILDKITEKVLHMIDGEGFKQEGAFNLRENGIAVCHGDSEHVKIRKKEDKQGIDIYIDKNTNGETVHIPVVVPPPE